MSLYLHPENQRLLWSTIQRHPRFNASFSNDPQAQAWFRGVVKTVYETLPPQHRLTPQELDELDKKTITYMIRQLDGTQSQDANYIAPPIAPTNTTSYYQKKSETSGDIQERFAAKQRELESFQRALPPADAPFEKMEADVPITNMDALIQQHLREREEVSRLIAPPVAPPSSATSVPIDLPKSVSWGMTFEQIEALKARIDALDARTRVVEAMFLEHAQRLSMEPRSPTAEPIEIVLDLDSDEDL